MRGDALRRSLFDPGKSGSFPARARRRRWDELLRRFPSLADMTVLDLGGGAGFWRDAPVRPAHVTLVNLVPHTVAADEPWITGIVGDACAPRQETYDLVVSNSLLEHVGGHRKRAELADVIHAAAPRHWVQTPYRYFPIEPHWVFPAMQWLPFRLRVAVSKHWPVGHIRSPDHATAVRDVADVELVGITEMRQYFPGSDIWLERWAGLPKSLVAVKSD